MIILIYCGNSDIFIRRFYHNFCENQNDYDILNRKNPEFRQKSNYDHRILDWKCLGQNWFKMTGVSLIWAYFHSKKIAAKTYGKRVQSYLIRKTEKASR